MTKAWIAALALAVALGCAKREPAAEAGAAPMSAGEKSQGQSLCDAYVARVCGCASRVVELEAECAMARSRPEALVLHLALLGGARGQLNASERELTESAAREVIAGCVQADARLSPDQCPRPAVR